jgi:hypothetical protein
MGALLQGRYTPRVFNSHSMRHATTYDKSMRLGLSNPLLKVAGTLTVGRDFVSHGSMRHETLAVATQPRPARQLGQQKTRSQASDHNAVRVNQKHFHLTMICGPALKRLSQVIISQGVGTEGVLAQSAGPG